MVLGLNLGLDNRLFLLVFSQFPLLNPVTQQLFCHSGGVFL